MLPKKKWGVLFFWRESNLREDAQKASGSSAVVKGIPVTVLSFDMNTQFPWRFYSPPLPKAPLPPNSQPLHLSFSQQTFLSLSIINSPHLFMVWQFRLLKIKTFSLSLQLFMTNWEQVVEKLRPRYQADRNTCCGFLKSSVVCWK